MSLKQVSLYLGVHAFNSKATTCVRCSVSKLTRRIERGPLQTVTGYLLDPTMTAQMGMAVARCAVLVPSACLVTCTGLASYVHVSKALFAVEVLRAQCRGILHSTKLVQPPCTRHMAFMRLQKAPDAGGDLLFTSKPS